MLINRSKNQKKIVRLLKYISLLTRERFLLQLRSLKTALFLFLVVIYNFCKCGIDLLNIL